MPDILKCNNSACPHSGNCYRFLVLGDDLQYAVFKPDLSGYCIGFWDNEEREKNYRVGKENLKEIKKEYHF